MAALSSQLESVLQLIHASAVTFVSSGPDSTALRQADTKLQQVKASLSISDAIRLSAELLAAVLNEASAPLQPLQMQTIHFGFQVIEERAMVPDWVSVATEAERAQLRSLALNLLACSSTASARACFPGFVRAKIASFLVGLAMREWPQYWDDFVGTVITIGRDNPGCRDVVCDIFRTLADDVHEFGDRISSSRRADLSKALTASVDAIIAFVTACTENFFNSKDEDGLCEALRTFQSLLSWCDMGKALRLNVPTACLSMLVYEGRVRTEALEALAVFCSRKVPRTASAVAVAKDPIAVLIRQKLFPGILEAVKSIPALNRIVSDSMLPGRGSYFAGSTESQGRSMPESIDSDTHEFVARFTCVATELGVTHFGICFLPFELSASDIPDSERGVAAAYIDLMLCAISHPSVELGLHSSRFFATAFVRQKKKPPPSRKSRKPTIVDPSHGSVEAADATEAGRVLMSSMVYGLIDAAPFALLSNSNDGLLPQFADVDFDGDDEERKDAIRLTKNRITSSLSIASSFRPVQSLIIAMQRLSTILETAIAAGQSSDSFFLLSDGAPSVGTALTHIGLATQGGNERRHPWEFRSFGGGDGVLVLALSEAIVASTEPVVAGTSSVNVFSVENLAVEFQRLFDKIAGIGHSALQAVKVGAFKMFIPLFIEDKSRLGTALDVLVSIVSLDGPPTLARDRASQSLAALCRRVSRSESKTKLGVASSLAEVRHPLCEFVAPILVSSNRSSNEKTNLLDAAITCVLTLSSMEEKTLWMNNLMHPLLCAIDPAQEWCRDAFQSAVSLLGFVETEPVSGVSQPPDFRQSFFQALFMTETSTHQVVRGASHSSAPISLPNPLSQSIAPRCVDVSIVLIPVLHNLYNETKVDGLDPSVRLPTSREISCLLNLEDAAFLNAVQAPEVDCHGIVIDAQRANHSDDLLRQVGVDPPSANFRRTRETLRVLRSGAYELARNSILSGVTQSPDHIHRLLTAVTTDYQYLEPVHLYYLMQRIVIILLSKQVASADDRFLVALSTSEGLIGLLRYVSDQIELIPSGTLSSSGNLTQDIAREHGRLWLCRVCCDLYTKSFGNSDIEHVSSVPVHMQVDTPLSSALWQILKILCSPIVAASDLASSRASCRLVGRSVSKACDNLAAHFSMLFVTCFQTDVYMSSRDSSELAYSNAVLEIAHRFPAQSTEALGQWMQRESDDVQSSIKEAFTSILAIPIDKKKGRSLLRQLVQRVSVGTGVTSAPKKKVSSLPKPKKIKNAPVLGTEEDVELVLGDEALDSLFGLGNPL